MIILDTHILHWWANQIPDKLPDHCINEIEQADRVAISALSCWEMTWLVMNDRIELDLPVEKWFDLVLTNLIDVIPVTCQIGRQSVLLPLHHKDPMDRIIYCHRPGV